MRTLPRFGTIHLFTAIDPKTQSHTVIGNVVADGKKDLITDEPEFIDGYELSDVVIPTLKTPGETLADGVAASAALNAYFLLKDRLPKGSKFDQPVVEIAKRIPARYEAEELIRQAPSHMWVMEEHAKAKGNDAETEADELKRVMMSLLARHAAQNPNKTLPAETLFKITG